MYDHQNELQKIINRLGKDERMNNSFKKKNILVTGGGGFRALPDRVCAGSGVGGGAHGGTPLR